MLIITLSLKLLSMTCIGIFMAKKRIVDDSFAPQLTAFLMKIALPCLVFTSITTENFSMKLMINSAAAIVLGAAACLLSFLMGQLVYLKIGGGRGRVFRYSMTFPHFSFMGIPVVDALFGNMGNLYYSMFLVPVRILYYGFSQPLLTPGKANGQKKEPKELAGIFLNPCMIAVLLGLLWWITGLPLPNVVFYCIDNLSKLCSPLGLILCGLSLGKFEVKRLLDRRFLIMPFIRLIVLPFIFWCLTRLLILAGMNPMLGNMMTIYTALPAASLTAAYTMQYEPDETIQFEAAGGVFFSTLLSAVTIPIWYMLLTLV